MCGIFGVVFPRSNAKIDAHAALLSIAHRGPDSSNQIIDEDIIFAHNRLAILDLTPAAAQPMQIPSGDITIIFNGEIYNHKTLRNRLTGLGYEFKTRSDTEVILQGYHAWGEQVFERLEGMFAIGIFDKRSRELILARDRSGKKPLFYAIQGSALSFASEIKAILASGFLMAEFETASMPFLMAFGYIPAPQTNYKGIKQLEPASILKYSKNAGICIRRYWQAPFGEGVMESSVLHVRQEIRRRVEAAVSARLEADVPIGAFLSGGVDSSIIVGVMSRLLDRPVKTFSIGFSGDARFDETAYARLVAKKFRTEHIEYKLTPASFELVEKLVELHDGPFGDPSAIPTYMVSKLARDQVTVALTGDGGDELFCGYSRFLAGEWAERIPQVIRSLIRTIGSTPVVGNRNFLSRLQRFLAVAALPLADRMTAWNSFMSSGETSEWSRALFAQTDGRATLSRILAHNFESYLPYDLLVKADRASMGNSLELRSPFLDTALIEYAARLPASMLHHGRDTKWILKQAFSDLLPFEIMNRSKMGFGMPLGTWFRKELSDYLRDYLDHTKARLYSYVDPVLVRRLLGEHMKGSHDHSGPLWLFLTLEIWLRNLRAISK